MTIQSTDDPKNLPKCIGDILSFMRHERNLTQSQLSQEIMDKFQLAYTVSQISRFENGTSQQPMEFVLRCCDIYQYHPLTFMICLTHPSINWWKVSLTIDSGAYYDAVISENFDIYGEQLVKLTPEDFLLAKRVVQTMFSTQLELRNNIKEQKTPLGNKRGSAESAEIISLLGSTGWP